MIQDKEGELEFQGEADGAGKLEVPLTQCTLHMGGKSKTEAGTLETKELAKTPHRVTVSRDGKEKSAIVEMTEKRTLGLTP